MTDEPLTTTESRRLHAAGYTYLGWRRIDGMTHLKFKRGDVLEILPRAAWRARIGISDPNTRLRSELQAVRAYLDYVLETYPPTSVTEAALRTAYEEARDG